MSFNRQLLAEAFFDTLKAQGVSAGDALTDAIVEGIFRCEPADAAARLLVAVNALDLPATEREGIARRAQIQAAMRGPSVLQRGGR